MRNRIVKRIKLDPDKHAEIIALFDQENIHVQIAEMLVSVEKIESAEKRIHQRIMCSKEAWRKIYELYPEYNGWDGRFLFYTNEIVFTKSRFSEVQDGE